MTRQQKKQAVEAALKQTPDKPNRQIAKETGTTHPYVAKLRAGLRGGNVTTPAKIKPGPKAAQVPGLIQQLDALRDYTQSQIQKHKAEVNKTHHIYTLFPLINTADSLNGYVIAERNGKAACIIQGGGDNIRDLPWDGFITETGPNGKAVSLFRAFRWLFDAATSGGINRQQVESLFAAGYCHPGDFDYADDAELLNVPGISDGDIKEIRRCVKSAEEKQTA